MESKNELKECPFCGGIPKMIKASGDERDGYADRISFVCQSCGCSRGACGDTSKAGYADNSTVERRALSAWNTRAASGIEAELECARGDLKTAMEIAEKNRADAERYRLARDGRSKGDVDICIIQNDWRTANTVILCDEIADSTIDAAIEKERT